MYNKTIILNEKNRKERDINMSRIIEKLNHQWRFAIDETNTGTINCWYQNGLPSYQEVSIPHTFNVEPAYQDYRGIAWYEYRFTPSKDWSDKRVRIQFNGVYRDVDIWVNGSFVLQHYDSGFTTFTVDITDFYKIGEENLLVLKVSNQYSTTALPYERSFDWADDGGIYREVSFLVTGKFAFDYVKIDAEPVIKDYGKRYSFADATWKATAVLCSNQSTTDTETYCYEILKGIGETATSVYASEDIEIPAKEVFQIPEIKLNQVALWHFDSPQLYTAVITLKQNKVPTDQLRIPFGFREFITEKHRFILNGETVRLCGTEWMPGSNPAFGNAEPKEYLFQTLKQLKETNCIFTRFHWQQDDSVYEWCDQNGMLVQEEIPNWGKDPKEPGEQQFVTAKKQIDEMISSHFNHPSIIMWGVGNEMDGQSPHTHTYVTELKEYTNALDSKRQINYVTNSILDNPAKDATSLGDILMINEYIGTWHGDLDADVELSKMIKANPDRPFVITEFGLCEPAHKGGDKRRSQVFTEKMDLYSKFPEISGTINFCLNDYRTQMGEEGQHVLRRRVHGSTDIFGEPKPSYYVVQKYCSPVEIVSTCTTKNSSLVKLQGKNALPSYMIKDYTMTLWNQDGELVETLKIPDLSPEESCSFSLNYPVSRIQINRPNQFLVEDLFL